MELQQTLYWSHEKETGPCYQTSFGTHILISTVNFLLMTQIKVSLVLLPSENPLKIFQYVHVISNERFLHTNDQINSKEQQYIRKENNETQSKTMRKIKCYLVNICVLIRHYMGTTLHIFIFKFLHENIKSWLYKTPF